MSSRVVEGTILDLIAPYADQLVTIRSVTPIATVDALYIPDDITTTTDSNGDFTVTLPVLDDPARGVPYLLILPNNLNLPFVLSAGPGAANLSSLFVQALPLENPNTIQTAVDVHAAIDAAEGTAGHVDYADAAFAAAVAAHGGGGGGGGAPTTATYITQTPNASLSAEQALSALATGLVKNTTATGVLSIATASDVPDLAQSQVTGLTAALDAKAPLASPTFTGTVAGITKAMVGLANVDNTADSAKPISTAQQTALDLKAPLASPTFTGTVAGITKAMVGLSNVDNTSDANKPVSIAAQTAFDLKAPLASPALTGTPTAPTATPGANTTQLATTAFATGALATHEADTTAVHGIADTSVLLTTGSSIPAAQLTGTIAQARLGTGSGGAGTKALYDDQTYKTVTASVADGDKGDITVSSSGTVWDIDAGVIGITELANDAVTYAKIQNVSANNRILGAVTAGDVVELTGAQVLTIAGGAPALSATVFVASQSGWPIPAGATVLYLEVIGGGGGGGSGRRGAAASTRGGGGGGGSGGRSWRQLRVADLGGATTLDITVPTGGPGGAARTADSTDGAAGTTAGAATVVVGSTTLVTAGGGGGAAGGTTAGGGGGTGGLGGDNGVGGGAGATTSGAGGSFPQWAAAPGGGGAGISAGDAIANGGAGGGIRATGQSGGAGGTAGGSGGSGNTSAGWVGTGGGGGASSITGVSGSGGGGGNYGSGGGGGAASLNGNNSGAGGNGAQGIVVIIAW